MGRDKGKGRGGGGGRGAGKRIQIANEEELIIREQQINEEKEQRAKRRAEGDEGEEGETKLASVDEDDEEDDTDDDDKPKKPRPIKPNNPNYAKQSNVISDDPEAGLSRKQKEELEEQRKHDEYMKRHLAGETEQARKDMERLAIIKKKREEDAKKRAQDGRAPGMSAHGLPSDSDDDGSDDDSDDDSDDEKKPSRSSSQPVKVKASLPASIAPVLNEVQAKKKAAALETAPASTGGEAIKLKPMDIKKMNGDALKDALRERNLDLQGQKKDLLKRLLDFEAARA